jgi:uncharacterized membrane protein
MAPPGRLRDRAGTLNRSVLMIPQPLHPAIVHFPVVLMLLLPLLAAGAWWAIRRGAAATRVWLFPVAGAAALALSAWAAVETGEAEEDRVERVVPEQAMHEHEEAAERFLGLSVALFALTSAGLVRGPAGRGARMAAVVGAAALVAAGVQVGHSGGMLVYRDGAASAYAGQHPAAATAAARAAGDADD